MPTYEYRCKDCGDELEVVQSFQDDALTECPACGGTLRKLFGNVGISFKGSGFYKNDSRSGAKSPTTAAAASDTSTTSTSDKSTSSDKGASSSSDSGSGSGSSSGSSPAKKESASSSTSSSSSSSSD